MEGKRKEEVHRIEEQGGTDNDEGKRKRKREG